MKLSAPIFRLKKQARALAQSQDMPLHEALNRIAKEEGFESWSLLSARARLGPTPTEILSQFSPGDFVLLAARPFQGKTTMGLSLIAEASRAGRHVAFFSLYLTGADTLARLNDLNIEHADVDDRIIIDTSNDISAPYIISKLKDALPGMLVVIDYLQILDQRRDTPVLEHQVHMLKTFAQNKRAVIVLISQIDRLYDPTKKQIPDLSDIHLPNKIDLSAFTKTCFLSNDAIQFGATT